MHIFFSIRSKFGCTVSIISTVILSKLNHAAIIRPFSQRIQLISSASPLGCHTEEIFCNFRGDVFPRYLSTASLAATAAAVTSSLRGETNSCKCNLPHRTADVKDLITRSIDQSLDEMISLSASGSQPQCK